MTATRQTGAANVFEITGSTRESVETWIVSVLMDK